MRISLHHLALLCVGIVSGCSDSNDPGLLLPTVVGISLDTNQVVLYLNGSRHFVAVVEGSNGKTLFNIPVSWTGSNSAVIDVSSDGEVVGVGLGAAWVKASADGFTDSAIVTVSPVPVRTITIVSSNASVGDTLQLVATTQDSNGTVLEGRSVSWTSLSGPTLVIVSPTGLLTSLKKGVATVQATSEGVSAVKQIDIGPGQFKQIGTGIGESCGIIGNAGIGYCWGSAPTQVNTAVPDPTLGTSPFSSIQGNFYGACALATGMAYCWGADFSYRFGSGQSHPEASYLPQPTAVFGNHVFAEISAGLRETCGVTVQHEGFCWGANPEAGIGNGDTSAVTPALIAGGLSWSSVSAALANHSCGITTTGLAYCWGTNHYGELGTGDTIPSLVPVPVAGGLTFKSISVGNDVTCAITMAGEAYCWGYRGRGGYGAPNLGTTAPEEFCDAFMNLSCNKSPVPVAGGGIFTQLEAGQGFACALATSGTVVCWGLDNSFGQMGLSSLPDQCGDARSGLYPCSRTPYPVNTSLTFDQISVASSHVCGISAGRAYCWGQNSGGALGDPTLPFDGFSASPVEVVDPH